MSLVDTAAVIATTANATTITAAIVVPHYGLSSNVAIAVSVTTATTSIQLSQQREPHEGCTSSLLYDYLLFHYHLQLSQKPFQSVEGANCFQRANHL